MLSNISFFAGASIDYCTSRNSSGWLSFAAFLAFRNYFSDPYLFVKKKLVLAKTY